MKRPSAPTVVVSTVSQCLTLCLDSLAILLASKAVADNMHQRCVAAALLLVVLAAAVGLGPSHEESG